MSLVMTSSAGSYKIVFRDRNSFHSHSHSHSRRINWYSGVSGYSFATGIKEQGVDNYLYGGRLLIL